MPTQPNGRSSDSVCPFENEPHSGGHEYSSLTLPANPRTSATTSTRPVLLKQPAFVKRNEPNTVTTTDPEVLAVIPARGGSKGLPGKNIRMLLGKPLIAYSVELSQTLQHSVECVVSTDDETIAATSRDCGASVPFMRPPHLATDSASTTDALRHALETMEGITGKTYDMVLLLEPTSPTRNPKYVDEAITKLSASPQLDGVISVSEPFFNPLWVGVRPSTDDPSRLTRYFPQGEGIVRRQDTERFLHINGSFYVWRSDFIRTVEGMWFDEGVHGHVEIPEVQAFSIDQLQEFDLIQAVAEAGLAPLPGYDPSQ